jgi:hypothetical protein
MKALVLFLGYLMCLTLISAAAWKLPVGNFVAIIFGFTVGCVLTSRA